NWAAPARQHFKAGRLAQRNVELRLQQDVDFLVEISRMQQVLHAADLSEFLQVLVVEQNACATLFALGDPGGVVGVVEQCVGGVARARRSHPDGGGDANHAQGHVERGLEGVKDSLRTLSDASLVAKIIDDQREIVAVEACQDSADALD